jgi:hypothetical protein
MWVLDRVCKAALFYYMIKLFLSLTGLDVLVSNFVDELKVNDSSKSAVIN